MNVEYKGFLIRSYKRRLGSCDIKNRISFNWKLIFLPINVIDYVVIHELCHIIHINHSKLFWNEVSLSEKKGLFFVRPFKVFPK